MIEFDLELSGGRLNSDNRLQDVTRSVWICSFGKRRLCIRGVPFREVGRSSFANYLQRLEVGFSHLPIKSEISWKSFKKRYLSSASFKRRKNRIRKVDFLVMPRAVWGPDEEI